MGEHQRYRQRGQGGMQAGDAAEPAVLMPDCPRRERPGWPGEPGEQIENGGRTTIRRARFGDVLPPDIRSVPALSKQQGIPSSGSGQRASKANEHRAPVRPRSPFPRQEWQDNDQEDADQIWQATTEHQDDASTGHRGRAGEGVAAGQRYPVEQEGVAHQQGGFWKQCVGPQHEAETAEQGQRGRRAIARSIKLA